MPQIISNECVSQDDLGSFYKMKVDCPNDARMGQFYMLRAWGSYPVFSRPVSVFDSDGETVSFLYKVVGAGTEIFSGLKAGDGIKLQGPLGSSFTAAPGKTAMVGGGAGIAPFRLAARQFKAAGSCQVDVYLGFSSRAFLTGDYRNAADSVTVDVGGFITDAVDPSQYDQILTCGPEPMMRALYEKCLSAGAGERLYVSMEKRMACGVGACLVCSCKTAGGNKKVCKDGPVFKAKEVFGL